jgi:capsular exopolysaccharide synthesis family protein
MSKIFDAIKKDNVIDLSDISDAEPEQAPASQREFLRPALSVVEANAPLPAPVHTVPLRISSLSPIFPFDEGHYAAAEQYRIIRTKILHHPKKPRLIITSSACSGDGKTVTAINIAASLALKDELSVLLVDADLRRPRVAEALGIRMAPGLSEVLAGKLNLDAALLTAEQFRNLSILPSGELGDNPAELLDSDRFRSFIDEVRRRFSVVIFDATPVATVADYELLQHVCDGVVMIVRPEHTDRNRCTKVLELIPKEKLLGVVLNCVEDWWLWKTPAYDYYRTVSSERAIPA